MNHYPNFRNIFVYLTPAQRMPKSAKGYIHVGYDHLVGIIECILTVKVSVLKDDVQALLRPYVNLVKEVSDEWRDRYAVHGNIQET